MALKVYNAEDVDLSIAGVPINGFGADEFISIEMSEDAFELVTGVDNESVVSRRSAHNADMTVTLMSSSKSNDFLSALYIAARSSNGSAGVVPILVKDRNTSTLVATATGFIVKLPPTPFGAQSGERAWTFKLVDVAIFVGGSS